MEPSHLVRLEKRSDPPHTAEDCTGVKGYTKTELPGKKVLFLFDEIIYDSGDDAEEDSEDCPDNFRSVIHSFLVCPNIIDDPNGGDNA